MAADRAQHVAEVIRPALAAGRTVVTDRYIAVVARVPGLRPPARPAGDRQPLRVGHRGALARPRAPPRGAAVGVAASAPAAPATGSRRPARDFHRRVHDGFLQQAIADPERFAVIDGTQSEDAVADAVWEIVVDPLPRPRVTRLSRWRERRHRRSTCGPTSSARTTPSPSSPPPRPTRCTPTCSSARPGPASGPPPGPSPRCSCPPAARARRPSATSASRSPSRTPTCTSSSPPPPRGASTPPTAREIVQQAALSPAEGARKVLVLEDFHLIDKFGAILLKYVEEPPPSTFFVILAEDVPPELVTIASRSVRIDLGPVPLARRRRPPRRRGRRPPTRAAAIAAAAAGDLDRARLLATDERFAVRAAALARDARAARRHRRPRRRAGRRGQGPHRRRPGRHRRPPRSRRRPSSRSASSATGSGGAASSDIEDRHKREVRRHRTAELRFALATFAGGLPRRPRRRPPPRPRGRRPAPHRRTPRWPSSASPTSPCCSSRCSRSSRRSPPKFGAPARIAQLVEQRSRNA